MAALLCKGSISRAQAVIIRSLSAVFSRHFETSSVVQQQTVATETEDKPSPQDANVRPVSEMPGPRRLPLVGSLFAMLSDKDFEKEKLHLYWKKLIQEYGPIVRVDMPGKSPIVILTNPDDCETLTRVTMENPVRDILFAFKQIRKEHTHNYFEKKAGIAVENGEEWKRVRSGVQAPMMKPKNIISYLPQMDEVTHDFLDRIASFQKEYGEMPSNFQTELYKWALESISLIALSRRMGCLDPNLPSDSDAMTMITQAPIMLEAMNTTEYGNLWRFFPTPAYKRLKKSNEIFLRIADLSIKETERRLQAKESHSDDDLTLMETLLLTPGLSRKDVVTFILDMLGGGIDTTSYTVAYTLYLLARNPKCQARLQEEVDTVLGNHKGPITSKHMGELSYLKCVVKESLRVFPLAMGTTRTLQNDTVFSGYLVPKGFIALSFNMYMGHDERVFPRAKEFLPERWSRDRPLGPIHPYASLPFGFGSRMCVGRRIAEQEIYTLLARIMQRYSVDYKYKDMGVIIRMVAVPSEPLRFTFTERR